MKSVGILTVLLAPNSLEGFISLRSKTISRKRSRQCTGWIPLHRSPGSSGSLPRWSTFHPLDSDYKSSKGMSRSLVEKEISEIVERILLQSKKDKESNEEDLLLPSMKTGLTKVHLNILSRTQSRQRFVSGQDPVRITVKENPTKRWLQKNAATVQLLINGTTVDNSFASFEKFQWLDEDDRINLVEQHSMHSFELVGEINIKNPGYLNILPTNAAGSSAKLRRMASASKDWDRFKNSVLYEKLVYEELGQQTVGRSSGDRLWITGFNLYAKGGEIYSMDVESGAIENVNDRICDSIRWPNESNHVPKSLIESTAAAKNNYYVHPETPLDDALLVSDGFLVPGKDQGGLYVIKKPGEKDAQWNVCLTGGSNIHIPEDHGWFYHRSVWIDLTKDGRKSILTARAKMKKGTGNSNFQSQLIWLEMPKPHRFDEATGTPLEDDGTVFDPFDSRHLPWKSHVLVEGPDVMFSIADMDSTDNTVEVFASHFFDRKLTMHSIERGDEPRIVFEQTIDNNCGAAFGCILANLNPADEYNNNGRMVIDSGSTVPTLNAGDPFSHLLVTSHQCSYQEGEGSFDESKNSDKINGGSLFAYRVPDSSNKKDAWKYEPWLRTTVISDFTVKGQINNMINPGAPGFVYTFYAKKKDKDSTQRPLIAIAGDCAESAYILRPYHKKDGDDDDILDDPSAQYKIMCEIECGSTVGSIGVGYENFMHAEQEENYAKLYIPCYERDKILVFAMGSGGVGLEE